MPSLDFLKSTPQTEALAIESEPPGAEAKASTGETCRTPCQLTVQPGGELSVTLALNGYQPQTVSVREAEGATSKLAPNPVFVQLQPAAAPSARKPAAKKKKPVTAAVRPPPSATASATNYPWPSR
jgi:hypothetical protein